MGPEDKLSPSIEDLPYFAEKYPGKVCCLCNLGERSSLGQGDLLRIETQAKSLDGALLLEDENGEQEEELSADKLADIAYRRSKANNKSKLLPSNECINELDKIGHSEHTEIGTLLDGTYIYVHRMCAMWSTGINRNSNDVIGNIEIILSKSLKRRCSFCGVFGASVCCKMNCKKMFHLPCAAASGALLITSKFAAFCVDHLGQANLVFSESSISCHQCSSDGDISKLVMCSTCGGHYHTTCVGLANLPETKSGWNCSQCSKCQICRLHDSNEGRTVKCEQCQKVYHATCLRPIISSIPKYGWKCNRCRICTDCGSRTPGAGTSSRWHCHYTICDSCYQQRNKGFSCPICHRAYRAAAHKEMVKCSSCNRFVHGTCDNEADLATYHKRKESNPDYDYICPQCKKIPTNERGLHSNNSSLMGSDLDSSGFQSAADGSKSMDTDFGDRGLEDTILDDYQKMYKKRIGFKDIPRRGGKTFYMKTNPLSQLGRKRAKGKNRHMLVFNSQNFSSASGSSRMIDDELSVDKKVVLCSAKDDFILSQDLCVMCGAIGIDKDGVLIACAQCGQCYHPYCVNIKVSKVMLEKGWRCLDCTVCEGCGQKNDESRLLLCDECDISYHIYCMTPPLDTVPHGNWKCKWCAICQKCGSNNPGKNSQWKNGFLECGPCASQSACCVCLQAYVENDMIIQCRNCERWLHCRCDSIKSKEEAQFCDSIEYHCKLCRPKDKSLSYLIASKALNNKTDAANKAQSNSIHNKSNATIERQSSFGSTVENNEHSEPLHWIDGVCVSERGLNAIKSLTSEIKKKRKMRSANDLVLQKDLGILATIESVVSGSDNCDGKKDENLKDGMVWHGQNGVPPPGFSVTTNEDGVNILRKKRQRNLQKMGIGGFNVRNRAPKKDNDEKGSVSEISPTTEPDKKKKIIRKKLKSKLVETYPVYLQEAFFGKELLSSKDTDMADLCESDSSEDACKELELLQFNTKSSKNIPSETTTVQASEQENIAQKTFKLEDNVVGNVVFKSEFAKSSAESKRANSNSNHNEMHKYAVSRTDFSLMNENIIIKQEKPHTPETGKLNNVNVVASFPEAIFEETNTDVEQKVKNPTSCFLLNTSSNKINSRSALTITTMSQEANNPNDSFQTNEKIEKRNHSTQQLHQDILPENFPQSVQLQSQIMLPMQNSDQQVPYSQQQSFPNMGIKNYNNNAVQMQIPQERGDNQLAKQQNVILSDMKAVSNEPSRALEEPPEGIAAGTQKTAEKMRRDEELGTMATISAVLYSNTQHPELKQTYPNWNDRCKQILKRWRSLSTEKKAPFLQQAKDNRSALRMRRTQQEQERINIQHKVLKEQEQERIWKLHQAKVKEVPVAGFKNDPNKFKENGMQTTVMYTLSNLGNSCSTQNILQKDNIGKPPLNPHIKPSVAESATTYLTQHCNPNEFIKDSSDKIEHSSMNVDEGNKHLRTLLQKQTITVPCTPSIRQMAEPFEGHNKYKNDGMEIGAPQTQTNISPSSSMGVKSSFGSDSNSLLNQEAQSVRDNFRPRSTTKLPDCNESSSANELEKLDPDAENAGFGDILGGFGEGDDDDLLKSLTAEIGDDFNILEYADPELDALANNQNLLSKLDFDDGANNN